MNDDLSTTERSSGTRRVAKWASDTFASPEVEQRYVQLTEEAQDHFLAKNFKAARLAAMRAIRIRPTGHLFSLCAAVAEATGNFSEACDFRLLQAFQARDAVLWRELLHDFLEANMWFRATVCLRRLAMLEAPGSAARRDLLLQLADLYVSLSEHARAVTIYMNLWRASEYKDFDVFTTLASLFFQLGRWSALDRLLRESLQRFLTPDAAGRVGKPTEGPDEDDAAEAARGGDKRTRGASSSAKADASLFELLFQTPSASSPPPAKRPPRPEGGPDDADSTPTGPSAPADAGFEDFDMLFAAEELQAAGYNPLTAFGGAADVASPPTAGGADDPFVPIKSPEDTQSYLSLINVYAELLNERGQFDECVSLVLRTAAHLVMSTADLPPDLLLKFAIAEGFLGNQSSAHATIIHILHTCSPAEFGDVLFDAAETFVKIGMASLAETVFRHLLRFSRGSDDVDKAVLYAHRTGESMEALRDRIDRDVALLFGIARCTAADVPFGPFQINYYLGPAEGNPTAEQQERRREQHPAVAALLEIRHELDPFHEPTRGLLATIYHRHYGDFAAAEEVLLPPAQSLVASNEFISGGGEGSPTAAADLPALSRLLLEGPGGHGAVPRETAFQRTLCDLHLLDLYAAERLHLPCLQVGVPLFAHIAATIGGEDDDFMSVAAGAKKQRTQKLSMPTLSRASSAIVPASRVAGSLAGDSVAASSRLMSATRSIATSFRAAQSHSVIALQRRGVAAGSSHVTSSTTTALTVAGSGTGPASSVSGSTDPLALKDSTGIFRFNVKRTRAGDAKPPSPTKKRPYRSQIIKSRSEIRAAAAAGAAEGDPSGGQALWEVSSVGNLQDIAAMEELLGLFDTPGVRGEAVDSEGGSDSDGARDDEGFLLPSAGGTAGAKKKERSGKGGRKGMSVDADADGPDAMPSLDDIIAANFSDDPAVADLFRRVTEGTSAAPTSTDAAATPRDQPTGDVVGAVLAVAGAAGAVGAPPAERRPPAKEIMETVGRARVVSAVLKIIEAYSALGEHAEARDFGTHISTQVRRYFRRREFMLVPVRIAVMRQCVLAGEVADAARMVITLLQQEGRPEQARSLFSFGEGSAAGAAPVADSPAATARGVWETIAAMVNGGMKSAILRRLALDRGRRDVELLCIEGNLHYNSGSFRHALRYYLAALAQAPKDALLLLLCGLCYIQLTMNRAITFRHECAQAGFYYLQEYYRVVASLTPAAVPEALYNIARAYEFLSLIYLAQPLYERAIKAATAQLVASDHPGRVVAAHPEVQAARREHQQTLRSIAAAARFNLARIYSKHSGNEELALATLAGTIL